MQRMITVVVFVMIGAIAILVGQDREKMYDLEVKIEQLQGRISQQDEIIQGYIDKVNDLSLSYIRKFGSYPRTIR